MAPMTSGPAPVYTVGLGAPEPAAATNLKRVENNMLNDNNTLMKWEYTIVHTDRLNTPGGPQLAPIWRRKYADGSTDWDQSTKLGEDGWEMVNAFPVEGGGTIQYLAFIFKRPKRASSQPPALETPAEASVAGATDEPPNQPDQAAGTHDPAGQSDAKSE